MWIDFLFGPLISLKSKNLLLLELLEKHMGYLVKLKLFREEKINAC